MSAPAADVIILYNRPGGAEGIRTAQASEAGVLEEVRAVEEALGALGIPFRSESVRFLRDIPAVVTGTRARVVFNLVESLEGRPGDVNAVPAVCRALERSATGNDTPSLELALDKWIAKSLLAAAGIPTPPAALVLPGEEPPADFELPAIVKPLGMDASEGIDASSVIRSVRSDLVDALRRVHERWGQPALLERYVEGREINVSLLEHRGEVEVLPPAEIDFSAFPPGRPRIVDYAAKWIPSSFAYRHTPRKIPAELDEPLAADLRRLARASWDALRCRDYVRVDFRVDPAGRPWVLEVNANPDISRDAGFAAALGAAGIPYESFVRAVVENARRRLPGALPDDSLEGLDRGGGWRLRTTRADDRGAILEIIAATGRFRSDEQAVAWEVLREAETRGATSGYHSWCLAREGTVAGWVCFGPTPCCAGTFDVYWLAVDPAHQGRGLGRILLEHAESEIRSAGGRLSVVETSSRADYEPTRAFYRKMGYSEAARLAGLYAAGDDKIVFLKDF
ncbi:MAG: GNAT family N-acetyltransferase [Planctomycetes bacterium]|nr:GNAT family N-acetyltransferase [Planctomycetota bacterium]